MLRKVTAICLTIFQPVAELLDRDDGVGEEGQLLAQPADVHVDRARAAGVLVAPHVGQQQVARQHAAAVLDQILEQQEFLRGQPHLLAVHVDGVPLDVDRERAVFERRRPGPTGRCARRSSAATRAVSSRGLNGLVT